MIYSSFFRMLIAFLCFISYYVAFGQIGSIGQLPQPVMGCPLNYTPGWVSTTGKLFVIPPSSQCSLKVGIFTDDPQALLDVRGDGIMKRLMVNKNNLQGEITALHTIIPNFPSSKSSSILNLGITSDNGQTETSIFTVKANGELILSDGIQPYFKLNPTDKTVYTREVVVSLNGWEDRVFHSDYPLIPLPKLRTYITQHHHLPDIPDEATVLENGISLGEMNRKLVQKVEELTLYLLQQDEKITAQEQRIEQLEKQLK